jgi:hypothetical protein
MADASNVLTIDWDLLRPEERATCVYNHPDRGRSPYIANKDQGQSRRIFLLDESVYNVKTFYARRHRYFLSIPFVSRVSVSGYSEPDQAVGGPRPPACYTEGHEITSLIPIHRFGLLNKPGRDVGLAISKTNI